MHGAVTCIAWHAPDQRAVHDAHYCGVSASENDMYFILFMLVLQGNLTIGSVDISVQFASAVPP